MPSKSEQVLQALFDVLVAGLPAGVTVMRNSSVPEEIPAAGLAILHDGDPGEYEFLFSPARYFYEHRAEIDVIVEGAPPEARDAVFDAIKTGIAAALAVDRTLGGLCDYVLGEAPAPAELPVEGSAGLKAAVIAVTLQYDTPDPLA